MKIYTIIIINSFDLTEFLFNNIPWDSWDEIYRGRSTLSYLEMFYRRNKLKPFISRLPSDLYSDPTLGLCGLWVGGWSVTEGCYWGPKRSSSQGVRDGASAGQHTWHNKTDGIRIASYLIGFPFQECDREIKFGRSFLNNTQYTRKESSLYCWRNYKVNDEMQVIWIMMLLITLITLLMAGKY